jgi:hypothetical protein
MTTPTQDAEEHSMGLGTDRMGTRLLMAVALLTHGINPRCGMHCLSEGKMRLRRCMVQEVMPAPRLTTTGELSILMRSDVGMATSAEHYPCHRPGLSFKQVLGDTVVCPTFSVGTVKHGILEFVGGFLEWMTEERGLPLDRPCRTFKYHLSESHRNGVMPC